MKKKVYVFNKDGFEEILKLMCKWRNIAVEEDPTQADVFLVITSETDWEKETLRVDWDVLIRSYKKPVLVVIIGKNNLKIMEYFSKLSKEENIDVIFAGWINDESVLEKLGSIVKHLEWCLRHTTKFFSEEKM